MRDLEHCANGGKRAEIYDPRVADLIPGDFLEVRCACGHETLIPQDVLLEKLRLRRDDRIADLGARLRCRECDERGKVVVSVR